MLIEFDISVLEKEKHSNKLSFLYNLCYIDRRYDLFIDVEFAKDSCFFSKLQQADRIILDDYYVRQVQEVKEVDYLLIDETSAENYHLTLDEAISFLNQPVCLVLENSQNDKHFFEAIVRNFTNKSKQIAKHLSKNWLIYGNAGGCTNVEAFLTEKIESFKDLPKPGNFYIRCFVLIDSDSEYPEQIKPERATLSKFLKENNIPYHFLSKREMENYLPDNAFIDAVGSESFKKTYLSLNPIQKDYMDIEKGIKAVNLDNVYDPIGSLYSNLGEVDRNIIRNKGLNMEGYKSSFPLLFKSEKVTQESLLQRTSHQGDLSNEHGQILDKINEII